MIGSQVALAVGWHAQEHMGNGRSSRETGVFVVHMTNSSSAYTPPRPTIAVPFAPDYRASGVLLHMTSLPSAYGVGDFGPAALDWVDRLVGAGQSWWQVLPLGPTGLDHSPYLSQSSFACNPLLISPDLLIEDHLLRPGDCAGHSFPADHVAYEAVIEFKEELISHAWNSLRTGIRPDLRVAFDQFCHDQAHWLDDYALFKALQAKHPGLSCFDWPVDHARRDPVALAAARRDLRDMVDRFRAEQFLLFRQREGLEKYAHRQGLRLIGDLPFFAALDSCEVWANPELFLLDDQRRPRFVAGVPPDYFSPVGQLWGNPLYNWNAHRRTGFRWWIDRVRSLSRHADLVRLDHFRGLLAAWHVPAGAPTAESGQWLPGPGAELLRVLEAALGELPFIAEDLGLITPDVDRLRDEFHLPGMRVLQFAFDGRSENPHLPENYVHDTVVYTGTHDNDTTRGWYERLPGEQRSVLRTYLKGSADDSDGVSWELIRLAWSSMAALAVVPLQDLLNLGSAARMNVPGLAEGNWRWRVTDDMLSTDALQRLGELTKASSRYHRQGRPVSDDRTMSFAHHGIGHAAGQEVQQP